MGPNSASTAESTEGNSVDLGQLYAAAAELGIELSGDEPDLFERYAGELVEWNRRFNLTRIDSPDGIAVRHFADSLVCLQGLPATAEGDPSAARPPVALRCVDVGSGAGLPGLPLKIVRRSWALTLVESVGKKADFLEHVVEELGLDSVVVERRRAEAIGQDPKHREAYDLAVSRAVADLAVLLEYMLPLVEIGGRVLALKGPDVADEVLQAEHAMIMLGGRLVEVRSYRLTGVEDVRNLIVVDKVAPTPDRYPRRVGIPSKRPLGA